MVTPRGYEQACPLATSLDIVGSRWALLVVRELILGPRRFSDIEAGLESASADMVTSRLRQLEAAAVLERTNDRRYQLTAHGYGLVPAIDALSRWAAPFTSIEEPTSEGSADMVRRVMTLLAIRARTRPIKLATPAIRLTCEHISTIAKSAGDRYIVLEEPPGATPENSEAIADTADLTMQGLAAVAFGAETFDILIESGAVSGTQSGIDFLDALRFQPAAPIPA